MIIKYSNTTILSKWDNGVYGTYRRKDDRAVIIISHNQMADRFFTDNRMSDKDKDHYKVQFVYELAYLQEIYQNKNIEDTLQNIKNDVDYFLIRMSKMSAMC